MTCTYEWPRGASSEDSAALEAWLAQHGWEVDPTVFMAGARGPAVQVRRVGSAWEDGEPGLLILPGEVVEYDGSGMRIATSASATATVSA
ncbi:hypothetical protein HUT19_41590 (plasmid) [Streptomyces sp. NA02950]|uniref:hypothetical protein n=1 Tax=Streptomyces sp. NA02950 TaxID=2742137 RepID=UPI00158FE400|nr:hypothetical protein [Streptomyces sp. NA02950]QKV98217.1 hypothetical protein HUT19_41590 [Streptomyces sp. NA02950]